MLSATVTVTVTVTVINETRGSVLASRCRVARSLRDRTIGLLGTRALPPSEGLLIQRSPSIHMFFMRYAIDAVFLDRDGVVTHTVVELRPWRAVLWARGSRDCLELPTGTIARSGTRLGDRIVYESAV